MRNDNAALKISSASPLLSSIMASDKPIRNSFPDQTIPGVSKFKHNDNSFVIASSGASKDKQLVLSASMSF